MTSLPPPELVQDERGLERLLEDLEPHGEIGFDTEADSFFHYKEKVCLIQVSTCERDYLVDPLVGLDLSGVGRVLADPGKTVIFHDGEYDILILKRDFGFEFAGLWDTRVAAAALGMESPGLASVIRERFGVELDKSMQRSNWSQRPLSAKQIAYARYDTRFLIPLMHQMREELEQRGRTMILEGECRRLERLEPPGPSFQPDEFLRIKGASKLSPQAQQNLRELFVLREEHARQADLPPFKIVTNPTLVEIAVQAPASLDVLGRVHGFSGRQVRRLGADVLAALRRAAEKGPLTERPSLPRRDGDAGLSERDLELHDALKRWRKERAEREGIESSLILNRHVLRELAVTKPRNEAELRAVDGLLGWQMEMFGAEILQALERGLHERRARGGGPARGQRRRRGSGR